ncbi:MAG: hypothetical protein K2X61_08230 [Caulobacteraceae bacterium]|nr:hypothetical protein [Caulobacteraceae bacterium]
MSLADDPSINPEAHDLARALAHDHIIGVLAFMFVCNQADRQGVSATEMAKTVRDSVIGSWTDGGRGVPPEFAELIRAHTAKIMDHMVGMCATNDELRNAGKF